MEINLPWFLGAALIVKFKILQFTSLDVSLRVLTLSVIVIMKCNVTAAKTQVSLPLRISMSSLKLDEIDQERAMSSGHCLHCTTVFS